jgi:hypothetical protein
LTLQIGEIIERAKDYDDGLAELQQSLAQAMEGERVDQGRQDEEEEVDEPDEENEPVLHHAVEPKKRKKSVPWKEDEERFLSKLIKEHGAKWSYFELHYGQDDLYGRSQTAMKDKARNMMRLIVNSGTEKEFLQRFPKWAEVTVGLARRGVHAYEGNEIPVRKLKSHLQLILDEDRRIGVT